MDKIDNSQRRFLIVFAILVAVSSMVIIEPAPYDLLLVMFIGIAIICQYVRYVSNHFLPVFCLLVFIETNVMSLFFVQDMNQAGYYLLITLYCVIAFIGMIGIAGFYGIALLPYVFYAYVFAGLLVVIPGMIAYAFQGTVLDLFLWEGRVKGLFKDPNVFGPFLVPPSLFALWQIGGKGQKAVRTMVWVLIFIMLTIGILLSFSRAAWGQFILAMGLYFLMMNDASTKRMKTCFILIVVFVPVLIYVLMHTSIGDLFFDRFGIQHYDQTRFQKQEDSLAFILAYPLGFGPGQSELFLDHATHNLYIRILSENGLLGWLAFILFFFLTLGRSFYMVKQSPRASRGYVVIITASLVGILFNSLFIDTMHWRHFWLLLALPWMNIKPSVKRVMKETRKQMR